MQEPWKWGEEEGAGAAILERLVERYLADELDNRKLGIARYLPEPKHMAVELRFEIQVRAVARAPFVDNTLTCPRCGEQECFTLVEDEERTWDLRRTDQDEPVGNCGLEMSEGDWYATNDRSEYDSSQPQYILCNQCYLQIEIPSDLEWEWAP